MFHKFFRLLLFTFISFLGKKKSFIIQSGRSSLAKHGGAYFSAIYGSIEDPIAVPGPYENQEV